jgi:septum site-determining protein MinD
MFNIKKDFPCVMMSIMTAETYLILSGKGGVGRTVFFSNLATSLAKLGKDTVLLDADLAMADIGLTFGLDILPVTLHEVLAGKESIERAIYEGPYGVKVIPSGHTIEGFQAANPEGLVGILEQLKQDADYLLIDTPTGINEDVLLLLPLVDHIIILATSDLPSIADALKIKVIAESLNDKKINGVVINRVDSSNIEDVKQMLEKTLESKIISVIPNDPNMQKSLGKKTPLVALYPSSPASIAIKKLAADITGIEYSEVENNS